MARNNSASASDPATAKHDHARACRTAYVHLRVAAKPAHSPTRSPIWLDIVAGRSFVITRHDGDVPALGELDERISRDTTLGAIGGVEFVGMLLDHVVTGYLAAADDIEDAIDALDASLLRHEGQSQLLDRLVRLGAGSPGCAA